MGLRKSPLAFTEQGVSMLSGVLNSETAVEVNIQIIRIFSLMRELLLTHKDILIKLEQMEKKMIKQDGKIKNRNSRMSHYFFPMCWAGNISFVNAFLCIKNFLVCVK